jgi:hypothetical protein
VNGFIVHLYARLLSRSNYSAIANLHNLQITATPGNLLQPAVSLPAVPWQRILTVEILQFHALTSLLSGEYPVSQLSRPGILIQPRCGPNRKHRMQKFFYWCYGRLPSDSLDIVDVLTGRYQASPVLSRDRCIATVLHATI